MALDFGMLDQFNEEDVGIGQKNDKFDIRYEQSNTQPIISPGEIIIWEQGDGIGEFYASGDGNGFLYGANWSAQTFSAANTFVATKVTIRVKRSGTPGQPGNVILGIRATDGDGKPIGADLTSSTLNGNVFSTSFTNTEFTLTSSINLIGGTKYAIVVRATEFLTTPSTRELWFTISFSKVPYRL